MLLTSGDLDLSKSSDMTVLKWVELCFNIHVLKSVSVVSAVFKTVSCLYDKYFLFCFNDLDLHTRSHRKNHYSETNYISSKFVLPVKGLRTRIFLNYIF